ncbi:Rho-binding antiterminator [Aliikangiella coralliicola]|uniref:Uncharacterized protein n=1 Tax=Aliikangiella coralliicola TaxID=2592383 RepID=A0A545UG30_9GAMM|nr:Rho-binding antiterminator [Aliikangiella coralliicola]TQV88395.1 hypothetical protein FLL46_07690 [Aliikangiella coralliicola]
MTQDRQKIINCNIHDYIEIACMYSFEIELSLNDGTNTIGRAVTTIIQTDSETQTNTGKAEYLVLQSEKERKNVLLSSIKKMRAITVNPHFDIITF